MFKMLCFNTTTRRWEPAIIANTLEEAINAGLNLKALELEPEVRIQYA